MTTCARPGTLAAAAVISASPFPTAVTNPESSILATDCLDEVQVMVNPLMGLPAASLATAESWRVWPKAVSVVAAGLTWTTATRGGPTPVSPRQAWRRSQPTAKALTVRTIACAWELRSEEHTSELQSPCNLVCRLLL